MFLNGISGDHNTDMRVVGSQKASKETIFLRKMEEKIHLDKPGRLPFPYPTFVSM